MRPLSRDDDIEISVVVPSYNENRHIRHCLQSLAAQNTNRSYEVIVVDSSCDDTPRIIKSEFPGVRLIHLERRAFPAEARNLGAEAASGAIVAFLDADCVADKAWIESIAHAHLTEETAVGGAVSPASSPTIPGALLFAIEFSEFLPAMQPRRTRWLPSCNLSVRRVVLEEFGGFPTDMEASEDMMLSRTLSVERGRDLCFDPNIRIRHINRNGFRDFQRRLVKLGFWSARSRRSKLVTGGFLVRHTALIPFLVPYRLVKILVRLGRGVGQKRLLLLCLVCWPLLLLGLLFWTFGFWRGARAGR